MRELLWNNIESAKEVWIIQESLGIRVRPNTAMAISLDHYYTETRNKSEIQKSNVRRKTYEGLQAALKPFGGLAVHMEENLFAVVLEAESGGELHVRETVSIGERVRDRVTEELGLSISIGIGRRYSDIQNLHLSYKEAVTALNYKYFLGEGQVIHIDEVLPPSEDAGLVSFDFESALALKVLSCDKAGAFGVVDEVIRFLGRAGFLNPVHLKSRILELLASTVRTVLEAGADEKAVASTYGRYAEAILMSDTLKETEQQTKEFLAVVIDSVYRGRKRMNLQVFEKAMKYIQENFRRPLKLREVARYVHVSDCHFSHGFKRFAGMSFEEYLTKLRINEAKRLLLTTDMRVKEVGAAVGYRDPNYFGRMFREEVGVPPSKFRPHKSHDFERNYCEG